MGTEKDSMFDDCVAYAKTLETISSGMLQAQFKIGLSRSMRIIDQLEEAGIVSPLQEGCTQRAVIRIGPPPLEIKSIVVIPEKDYYADLHKAIEKIDEGNLGSAKNFINRFINTCSPD